MNVKKVFIIAEAGINHNGKLDTAKKLINIASKAKVDAIKFQLFKTDNFINKKKIPDIFKMFLNLEFSLSEWKNIILHAKHKNIKIFFSIFDLPSLNLLKKLKINLVKIPSGEINNHALLNEINKKKIDVILSTGMATIKEIEHSVNILKNCNVKLLHCVSEYPTDPNKLNLNFIKTLKEKFNLQVGFSDHTLGIDAPGIAVAAGAKIIEKHFTNNKNQEGGDHKVSINQNELIKLVKNIRSIEEMLGKSNKTIYRDEIILSKIARKGVYLRHNIKKKQILKKNNLIFLRPANSKNLNFYNKILGKKAIKNINAFESLRAKLFK